MHPTQVSTPFHREGWVYEEKVDGWRMLAVKTEVGVQLISRSGLDHTLRFPELVKDLAALKPSTFTLDGEVAVYDKTLISRFEWLRARPKDEHATLPVYMVFDVLELDGRDLRGESLRERRRVLRHLVNGRRMILLVRHLSNNGLKAWEEARTRGYEGIVAKDPESKYVPGRTLRWIKVKQKGLSEGGAGVLSRVSRLFPRMRHWARSSRREGPGF
jgi:bifunctional non-homologous end joining protein LigD